MTRNVSGVLAMQTRHTETTVVGQCSGAVQWGSAVGQCSGGPDREGEPPVQEVLEVQILPRCRSPSTTVQLEGGWW